MASLDELEGDHLDVDLDASDGRVKEVGDHATRAGVVAIKVSASDLTGQPHARW